MRYKVNENCIGCGLCEGVCPQVFKMNDSGLAEAIDADIPQGAEDAAAEAMASCPAEAIEQK